MTGIVHDGDDETKAETLEWWGLLPPANTPGAVWGARAIYRLEPVVKTTTVRSKGRTHRRRTELIEASAELLPDRQQIRGGTPEETEALRAWVNKHGLRALKVQLAANYITPECADRVQITNSGFVIAASPRESCGYLYVGAWKVKLTCQMTADCESEATHIDEKGFIYCTVHGMQRREHRPCRKLRPWELNKLRRGETIGRYS